MAVKVVYPELARDRAFINRFRQEVAAARRVSGAYTAPVVDAGDGEPPWLATALVMGPSLDDAVDQQGPLAETAVWRLAAGLAEALAEVHACDLVHRDLKPSNVLLAADGPRVIDFGISRALDGTGMTGTGVLVGTPGFMSPEQASGVPVGPPSDVFSFGGVVAFAATGTGPFGDGNPVAMIYRVVHGEPTLSGLPAALADLVRRCLAKRPDKRATMPELMEIITANLAPMTSAMSFWPPALAGYIGAYQAHFTADTRAWSVPVPERATPEPALPSQVPPPEAPPSQAAPVQAAPVQVPPPEVSLDGPVTITSARPVVTPRPFSGPGSGPYATTPPMPPASGTPPSADQVPPYPYTPPPSRPPQEPVRQPSAAKGGGPRRRRGVLIAGIGIAAAVVAVPCWTSPTRRTRRRSTTTSSPRRTRPAPGARTRCGSWWTGRSG
jgi:eukaryotic-like serine/threonine-protein kinase